MNNFIRHPNELAIKNITIPIDASNPMVKTWTGVTIWLSLPVYRKRVLIIHFPLLKIREHINQGSISRISINESKQLYSYLHNRQSYCSTSIHLHPTTSPKLCHHNASCVGELLRPTWCDRRLCVLVHVMHTHINWSVGTERRWKKRDY